MTNYEEIVQRAKLQRTAYIAELIARGLVAITRPFRRRQPTSTSKVWREV